MSIEQPCSQSDFLMECERAFAFLVREHRFTEPQVDCSLPGLAFVTYGKGEVGVECVLEQRDDDVSVRIVRLRNGKRPTAYRKDEDGTVVRELLTQLLIQRGVRDIGFPQPAEVMSITKRRATYRKALEGYARLLQNHAQDVLDGSERILDEAR